MNLSDILGIISIAITLIGFGITISSVTKARKISNQIRNDLKRVCSVSDFASALSCMTEIKNLHRSESWLILPDKYASLRRLLIIIRETNPDISIDSRTTIQSAITLLRGLEDDIEKLNHKETPLVDVPKFNRLISKQMDSLYPILVEMQNKVGR